MDAKKIEFLKTVREACQQFLANGAHSKVEIPLGMKAEIGLDEGVNPRGKRIFSTGDFPKEMGIFQVIRKNHWREDVAVPPFKSKEYAEAVIYACSMTLADAQDRLVRSGKEGYSWWIGFTTAHGGWIETGIREF